MSRGQEKKYHMSVLMEREGGKCFYCDVDVVLSYKEFGGATDLNTATRDHIIPESKGGKTNLDNLVLACAQCNQQRKTMPADQFLILKRKEMENGAANLYDIFELSNCNVY